MKLTTTSAGAAPARAAPGEAAGEAAAGSAAAAVAALYQEHALGLTRLAHIMLGDAAGAQDVVQEAFWGLYQHWDRLTDKQKAQSYLRSSVLNGCRSVFRRQARPDLRTAQHPVASAESAVLAAEERRQLMTALRDLPDRQREALVLRFYFDHSVSEIARDMGIGPSSVRSSIHRALSALARVLKETT